MEPHKLIFEVRPRDMNTLWYRRDNIDIHPCSGGRLSYKVFHLIGLSYIFEYVVACLYTDKLLYQEGP